MTSVTALGMGELLALRISGQNNLLVTLPTFVRGGAELILDVAYAGRLPPQELDREAITVDRQRLQEPMPELMLWPERRFMYSNRSIWYPQGPVTDYATATMRLTVPSKYQVVASGSPVGSEVVRVETAEGGERSLRTVEYVADRPARYLACIISRFVPVGRAPAAVPSVAPPSNQASSPTQPPGASVNVEIVSTPKMAGANGRTLNDVTAMLQFYAETIGEAPYPDFTFAALDDVVPGGHSPAFFAILYQPLGGIPPSWRQDPVWFDPYPKLFMAHEIAHQWWGQAVGWKNYHEQWLSEGLAQYFAVLYAASDRGPDTAHRLLSEMRDSAEDFSSAGPIYLGYRLGHIQRESRIFRGLIYNKSAVVLHMLRGMIGDEAFFNGIRRFYRQSRFQKAGTDDLRAAFEAETPMDLGRFFDRWIFGATLPRVRVQSDVEEGRLSATVRAEQTGEVFDLPLFLRVDYADGSSEELALPMTEAVFEHRIVRDRAIRRVVLRDELIPGDVRD